MEKIKELFRTYREMILYLFFGGCTTLVNIVAYYVSSRVGVGTAASTVIAWVLSVLFAYVTNRKYVFKSKATGPAAILKESAGFFLCRAATGLLDLAVMVLFVDVLHYNDMVIKIASNIIVIVLNYVASKLMIFKEKPSDKNDSNLFFRLLLSAPTAFRVLFCLFIAITLFMLIFIDKGLNSYFPPNLLTVSNKLLILPALLLLILIIGVFFLFRNKNSKAKRSFDEKQFYAVIVLCFAAVYLIQLFISAHIYLRTGWDVKAITETAESIASGAADGVSVEYYSKYPNNLLITYTLVILCKIGRLLFGAGYYKVILAFVSFIVCVSVFLATLCIYRMTYSRKFTVIGMLLGILLIAISPWIVIPYTDAIAMIFPVTAVFCYLYVKNRYIRYALITFICVLGHYYKPTVLIVLMALVILKLFVFAEKPVRKKLSVRRCVCMLLCVVISAGCAFGVNKAVCSQDKTELDENKRMTVTHYFMMGLNIKGQGEYSIEDVAFSQSMPDVESRQKANIEVAENRLKEMGLKGYIRLLFVKNIATYNDGIFGWAKEGHFYEEVYEDNSCAARLLRSFYYTNGQGTHHLFYATAEQILWLLVLICICFCVLPFKTKGDAENLIALSLFGVSLFLLLFECRARYLFLFTPLFVILATVGLYKAYLLLERTVEGLRDNHQKMILRQEN